MPFALDAIPPRSRGNARWQDRKFSCTARTWSLPLAFLWALPKFQPGCLKIINSNSYINRFMFFFCQRSYFFMWGFLVVFIQSSRRQTQECGGVAVQWSVRANGQPSGGFALWKALSQKWTGSRVSSAKQIAPNWGRLSTVKDFLSQVFLFSSSVLPECSHFPLAMADHSWACTVPLSSCCTFCVAVWWPS